MQGHLWDLRLSSTVGFAQPPLTTSGNNWKVPTGPTDGKEEPEPPQSGFSSRGCQ